MESGLPSCAILPVDRSLGCKAAVGTVRWPSYACLSGACSSTLEDLQTDMWQNVWLVEVRIALTPTPISRCAQGLACMSRKKPAGPEIVLVTTNRLRDTLCNQSTASQPLVSVGLDR
jgi:hypothetical protein